MSPDAALAAIDAAPVGIVAFRDGRGRPIGVPVTPYVDGTRVVVTSTLAFIRKAELIRRDSRIAVLAGGALVRGDAIVAADSSGDTFVARYLDQELRKYPPARAFAHLPGVRESMAWYFGRAIISIAPHVAESTSGSDAATLIRIGDDGWPLIAPLPPATAPDAAQIAVDVPDGPASVLLHRESPDFAELRWLRLAGDVRDGLLRVASRTGSLDGDGPPVDYDARAARARAVMADWPPAGAD